MDTRPERREAERQAREAQYQSERAEQKSLGSPPPTVSSRPHAQTGPRTAAGKSVSSMNAFRHGLTSARLVLPWENEDEFDKLLNQLIDEHQPATATESILTREMAEQYWRLQRVRNQEWDALAMSTGSDDELKRLTLLDRYATRHERSFVRRLNRRVVCGWKFRSAKGEPPTPDLNMHGCPQVQP